MRRLASVFLALGALGALAAAVVIRPRVGHPVTPAMRGAAEAATGRTVPPVPGLTRDRPGVVVFIQPGCPCSEEYEPYTHALFRAYGARARFVGIIAGDAREARRWREQHQTPFPVVPDLDHSLARGFGAERSAYTALVRDGQNLRTLWPGYSAAMLRNLGAQLAAEARIPAAALPTSGAPEKLTSGCFLRP